jgi:hypothetical protein
MSKFVNGSAKGREFCSLYPPGNWLQKYAAYIRTWTSTHPTEPSYCTNRSRRQWQSLLSTSWWLLMRSDKKPYLNIYV